MHKWILSLSSVLPESLVGRKAAALSWLVEKGFPVPAGVCVTTDAFNTAAAAGPEALHLPGGLLEELTGAFPTHMPLAVRSSAVLEDMPDTSLAGLYLTRLNVDGPAALERAVLDCWRSYLTAPNTIKKGGMSVLVQPMLDAECAGVCFTVDPVRLRPDLLLVVSAWGLGAGVVAGSVPTDTARLRRNDLEIEDYSIANKHTAIRLASSGAGVAPASVPGELLAIPCLPEDWLQRVGQFGLAIEQAFDTPQDVEWAVAGGQLWILQSRPITALPVETREARRYPMTWENGDEPRHYWWLFRAGDSAGAPLLPAELDFVRINARGGHDSIYYGGRADTRWLKVVNGRVYMAAAKSPHSPGHVRVYGAAMQDMYERLRQQNVTNWEYWGPEIVRATGRLAAFEAREEDGSGLADHLENAVATATRHWMIHTLNPRPIRDAALLNAYSRLTGLRLEDAAVEIPFLLAGVETIQTRLVEALYDLAYLALGSPETAKGFALGNMAGGRLDSPDLEPFALAFRRLIAEYGDRLCYLQVPGYPVELPLPWREAPEHVWKMIAAYLPLARLRSRARTAGLSPREARIEAKRAADERV
ncbi:MAG TPA: PEP/pyruvate-binding domain-containing protein, partial [Anaerolineales bacterium]